jgi:hypothetical protein
VEVERGERVYMKSSGTYTPYAKTRTGGLPAWVSNQNATYSDVNRDLVKEQNYKATGELGRGVLMGMCKIHR